MKKKTVRRSKTARATRHVSAAPGQKNYLLLLKSWMFVVVFALMLGVGAILGTFINQEMSVNNPQVAGVQIEVGY